MLHSGGGGRNAGSSVDSGDRAAYLKFTRRRGDAAAIQPGTGSYSASRSTTTRARGVCEPAQLDAMAALAVRSHSYSFGVALIFFGCECLVLGHLIFRSGYLPKAIGVLMQIAGLCYLTNSFALVLSPAISSQIFPAILIPPSIGETSLCLWLLVKGVNVEKWKLRAAAPN